MARVLSTQLPSPEAVLGLLIRQSDTVSSTGGRLAETFPHARFGPSTVHNAVDGLLRKGFVRVHEGPKDKRHLARYEATEEGRQYFRDWLRSDLVGPPVLRDVLQAQLAFLEPDDLPWVLKSIAAQERASIKEYEKAARRLQTYSAGHTDKEDWRVKLQIGIMTYDAKQLLHRVKELQEIRTFLPDCADKPAEVQ